jgi:hypothetical protein
MVQHGLYTDISTAQETLNNGPTTSYPVSRRIEPLTTCVILLRELYEGESQRAIWFRYSLALFDLLTTIFWS